MSELQKTLTPDTTVVPYKGTKLTSVAEILESTNYPIYLSIEYSPIKADLNHKLTSRINDTTKNAKIKEIPQEDLTNFVGRFLGGVSFAEGFYVEKTTSLLRTLKLTLMDLSRVNRCYSCQTI